MVKSAQHEDQGTKHGNRCAVDSRSYIQPYLQYLRIEHIEQASIAKNSSMGMSHSISDSLFVMRQLQRGASHSRVEDKPHMMYSMYSIDISGLGVEVETSTPYGDGTP